MNLNLNKLWQQTRLVLILAAFGLSGCAAATPASTATPLPPSVTPTVTLTATITPTPTITLTPTITPTPTRTATATRTMTTTPTLTPAGMLAGDLSTCKELQQPLQTLGEGALHQVRFSADGLRLAAVSGGAVHLYDLGTGLQLWQTATPALVSELFFSADGATLLGVDQAGGVYRWQVAGGQVELLFSLQTDEDESLAMVALSPDSQRVAVARYSGNIEIYSVHNGALLRTLRPSGEDTFGEQPFYLAFLPDSRRLLSVSIDSQMKIWSEDGALLQNKRGEQDIQLQEMRFSQDGRLAVVDFGDYSKVMRLSGMVWLEDLSGGMAALSADGFQAATYSEAEGLRIWGTSSGGSLLQTLPEEAALQGRPAFSADGKLLAVGAADGIHIWSLADARQVAVLGGDFRGYTTLAVADLGEMMAAGQAGQIELRNPADGSLLRTLVVQDPALRRSRFHRLALSADGSTLAAALAAPAADGSQVLIWQTGAGTQIQTLSLDEFVNGLALSPDGTRLATTQGKGALTMWDVPSGTQLFHLEVETEELFGTELSFGYHNVAFAPDGSSLAAAKTLGNIVLLDPVHGTEIRTLSSDIFFGAGVRLAFSHNSQTLVSNSQSLEDMFPGYKLTIHKVANGVQQRTLTGEADFVHSLAYAPGGQLVAAGLSSGAIQVWSTTVSKSCVLQGHSSSLDYIFFSSDARFIYSLDAGGLLVRWGLP